MNSSAHSASSTPDPLDYGGMPQETELEKALLGYILLRGNEVYEAVQADLSPEDFGVDELHPHRQIARAMHVLWIDRRDITRLSVGQKLNGRVELGYLADLEGGAVELHNLRNTYVLPIKEASQRRRLLKHNGEIDRRVLLREPIADVALSGAEYYRQLHSELSPKIERGFSGAEDHYKLVDPDLSISLDLDRLRREHHELIGELTVRCELPGSRSYNGVLSAADFNLSSIRARSDRAKLLAERARTKDVDWLGLLEELCQRAIAAERKGEPARDLRDFPDVDPDDRIIRIHGIDLPRDHPAIIFGDGGTAKSYLALWIAGLLARKGLRVALFDWELSGQDHRSRLKKLFGDSGMPLITYVRCERPLAFEADRLRRIAREDQVDYSVYDSIGMACGGAPESAEIAGAYFRAVRSIPGGSNHITHIAKAEGSDQYPFGSIFWHNLARSTWYVKKIEALGIENEIRICLYNRKANLTRLAQPVAFRVIFRPGETNILPATAADTPEFAEGMSLRQRMNELVKHRALTPEQIASELAADVKTVRRYTRDHNTYIVLDGGRIGLKQPG